MLISHIIKVRGLGAEHFDQNFPTILQMQDMIEAAWDRGINAQGRMETGGIKGTRKYIGTPEVSYYSHVWPVLPLPYESLDTRC